MGTARAFVAGSAVSWAERTARVPRPSLRCGASRIVLIRPSPGLRWIQKTRPSPWGEGRGVETCRADPATRSSFLVASAGCSRAGPVSRGEAAHAHAAHRHADAVEAHLLFSLCSLRLCVR